MLPSTKAKITNLITMFVLMLTTFQALIPGPPMLDVLTGKIVSASIMFAVLILTNWKQALSLEIRNEARIPTLIMTGIAVFGGANDFFTVFHFSDSVNYWIRFSITGLVAMFNVISKTLYPTDISTTKS